MTNNNTNNNNNTKNNNKTTSAKSGSGSGTKIPAVGSRAQVFHGTAKHTSGGLTKSDLMKKNGRIVSKKQSAAASARFRTMMKSPEFKTKWTAQTKHK